MAELIEKQELPVIITKIKIGTKDLTKKIIDQLPFGIFVTHRNIQGKRVYGLPIMLDYIKEDGRVKEVVVFDRELKYELDGTLIGFVKLPDKEIYNLKGDTLAYAERLRYKEDDGFYREYENFSGKFHFILWYTDDNKLKKGVVDQWTVDQLGIELEQIFV